MYTCTATSSKLAQFLTLAQRNGHHPALGLSSYCGRTTHNFFRIVATPTFPKESPSKINPTLNVQENHQNSPTQIQMQTICCELKLKYSPPEICSPSQFWNVPRNADLIFSQLLLRAKYFIHENGKSYNFLWRTSTVYEKLKYLFT